MLSRQHRWRCATVQGVCLGNSHSFQPAAPLNAYYAILNTSEGLLAVNYNSVSRPSRSFPLRACTYEEQRSSRSYAPASHNGLTVANVLEQARQHAVARSHTTHASVSSITYEVYMLVSGRESLLNEHSSNFLLGSTTSGTHRSRSRHHHQHNQPHSRSSSRAQSFSSTTSSHNVLASRSDYSPFSHGSGSSSSLTSMAQQSPTTAARLLVEAAASCSQRVHRSSEHHHHHKHRHHHHQHRSNSSLSSGIPRQLEASFSSSSSCSTLMVSAAACIQVDAESVNASRQRLRRHSL